MYGVLLDIARKGGCAEGVVPRDAPGGTRFCFPGSGKGSVL
ncbi:hypothetical protein DESPIG_00319 [Desulfovibrio piger ATCC 29098]|uniref:Uncharacterized protein n=1 Tax=Desulfovibrio piger ATCC 29098 TaxID=411464 RepID=B6WQJ5_9BACT|nr:hypothetical protein DESPIG_00319 [Desulfovibrio piger ATCC 29098]